MKLLSAAAASNAKTQKSQLDRPEYTIVTLSLSPAHAAPGLQTNCANATQNCIDACVGGTNVGMASVFRSIMEARIRKTVYMREDRSGFLRQLIGEIEHERDKARIGGTQLAVRLNCFSDLPWESKSFGAIPTMFPDVQFWDYTKIYKRISNVPDNYNLTASWTERPTDQESCSEILRAGIANVAMVFGHRDGMTGKHAYGQSIPCAWRVDGRKFVCYDGDSQDMRFLDWQPSTAMNAKYGRICALRLKAGNHAARLRAIDSGFAVTLD